MMPYYHVYVDSDGDEAEETDLSKEQLLKYIVKPYKQHRRFQCKGKFIYPADVTTVRVIETERPANEIVAERKSLVDDLIGTSHFQLLERSGRDVTREYLAHVKKEQKRKKTSYGKARTTSSKDIFIVHGKDYKSVEELKAMLSGYNLNPIILHEQPSGSRTIVEKLEKYSDVGYAFVLLTPDDIGGSFKGKVPVLGGRLLENSHLRARQNVVLEFGYFMGKLGRNKVCCLHKGNVELPSDMQGIVYVHFHNSVNEAKDMIVKELRAAGYKMVV